MINIPYKIIDLTHTLDKNTPSWGGDCGFQTEVKLDYGQCTTSVQFRVQQIKMHAGIGTHIDAPAHCVPGGKTIHEMKLNDLIAPGVMIDVSSSAHKRYTFSIQDIHNFEKNYGLINKGCFVMIRTGWEQFWHDSEKYRNNYMFPSVSSAAAEFLLDRGIAGLGIDTLSPDRPEDGFLVHKILLNAGKYIVENAANLSKLPPKGSFIMALPLKIKAATEAPIRLIALIDKKEKKISSN